MAGLRGHAPAAERLDGCARRQAALPVPAARVPSEQLDPVLRLLAGGFLQGVSHLSAEIPIPSLLGSKIAKSLRAGNRCT